jgi:hypothetical protein
MNRGPCSLNAMHRLAHRNSCDARRFFEVNFLKQLSDSRVAATPACTRP